MIQRFIFGILYNRDSSHVYMCVGGGGGGGHMACTLSTPLGLRLNMCPLNTNINVMHDLKVNSTLLATCRYIEPFS